MFVFSSYKIRGWILEKKTRMVSPAASLIDDLAAANAIGHHTDVDEIIEKDADGEDVDEDDDRGGELMFESPPSLRRTNSEYLDHHHLHHHQQPSFLSHFISSLPSTVLEGEEREEGADGKGLLRDGKEKETLNNSPPVLGTLRRCVTAPANNIVSADDELMHHTQDFNGVFRPVFNTRWNAYVDIKEENNKRYELGTWTTKESAARAHDSALLFIRGDSKETREMLNFPMSEYTTTLKALKDMNMPATATNEDFVEALVESSAKIERRQSKYRGVVKSKEHANKFEARIFHDEM
jgi:hypothetical protein